jgi:hypothetical protein
MLVGHSCCKTTRLATCRKVGFSARSLIPDAATRGIRHVTSFAVYVDADYRKRYGELELIQEYGEALSEFRPVEPDTHFLYWVPRDARHT